MKEEFKIRVKEILDNINSCSEFYIWGTGGVAGKFYEILKMYNLEPDGFIVSDHHREESKYQNKEIFEVSEIKSNLRYSCVCIAVHNPAEILMNVKKIEVKNVKIIDDTRDLCALYALKAIEYFEKNGIDNIEKEYMSINGFTFLNPFHTDWDYCLAWLVEYGDLICPAMLNDFNFTNEGPYEYDGVIVNENDIVIDCGANIGLFSAYAIYKGAKFVYAFEPVPSVEKCLIKTCDKYIDKISVEPYALSSSSGEVDFYIQSGNLTSGSMEEIQQSEKDTKLKVKMNTIDNWVKDKNIEKVDFIKADIEGAEREMLAGAKETIRKFLPKIAICTYHLEDDPVVLESMIRALSNEYVIEHKWKKLFAYVPQKTNRK